MMKILRNDWQEAIGAGWRTVAWSSAIVLAAFLAASLLSGCSTSQARYAAYEGGPWTPSKPQHKYGCDVRDFQGACRQQGN